MEKTEQNLKVIAASYGVQKLGPRQGRTISQARAESGLAVLQEMAKRNASR